MSRDEGHAEAVQMDIIFCFRCCINKSCFPDILILTLLYL